jgi:predicted ribonuclease toxin of YeeF-YezG toxin-antitoxin module
LFIKTTIKVLIKEVVKMKKTKNHHKIKSDFKHFSGFRLHKEAKEALDELSSALPNYNKYEIVSHAIMNLKKDVAAKKILGTDDLEDRLEILT